MITVEESYLFGWVRHKVFRDKQQVGIIFEKEGEDWPKPFQATGDGNRAFYDTLEEAVASFKEGGEEISFLKKEDKV